MILNIKGRFNLSNLWKYLIRNEYPYKQEKFCNNLSKIKIRSFNGINKIFVSHLDIPNIELQYPINTNLELDINYIEEELRRFSSFYNCSIFTKSKYKKKRLIIYHNNPMLIGLLDYIIGLSNYTEYHIFSSEYESINILRYLERKNNNIRFNDVEFNINSMFRLCKNEYDDIYNESEVDKYSHKIVFFSKENELYEIGLSIKWLSNFYISMPYNRFLIYMLKYYFKDFRDISIVSNSDGYCILYIKDLLMNRSNINISTEDILVKLNKWWKQNRKKFLPMKYKK